MDEESKLTGREYLKDQSDEYLESALITSGNEIEKLEKGEFTKNEEHEEAMGIPSSLGVWREYREHLQKEIDRRVSTCKSAAKEGTEIKNN